MDATLEVGPLADAKATHAHTNFWSQWSVWVVAAVLGLGALALVVVRRNKRQHRHPHAAR